MIASFLAALIISAGSPAMIQVTPDVVYSNVAGEQLKMDIYQPKVGSDSAAKLPAVVLIHGGSWIGGKRADMDELARMICDNGFVVANIQYRLAPKHKFPAFLHDAQTAVRFIRSKAETYSVDPNRIGSCGASAGSHIALMLGFRETIDTAPAEYPAFSSKTSVVFNIFGPTDMSKEFPKALDPLFKIVLGKDKAEAHNEIREGSPVNFIDKTSAPVFTLHGTEDPIVPVAQAGYLRDALNRAGIVNDLMIVEGMKHAIDSSNPQQAEGIKKGIAWLKRFLIPTGSKSGG